MESVLDNERPMPESRRLDLPLLPTGQSERYYLERFMRAFGEDWNGTAIIEAPTGHSLSVSPLLFTEHKTGNYKINKQGRAPYVLYIAETIKAPDEIRILKGDFGDRSLYFLSRFLFGKEQIGVIAVFTEQGSFWEGWTGYQVPLKSREIYFETKRSGTLIFSRPET